MKLHARARTLYHCCCERYFAEPATQNNPGPLSRPSCRSHCSWQLALMPRGGPASLVAVTSTAQHLQSRRPDSTPWPVMTCINKSQQVTRVATIFHLHPASTNLILTLDHSEIVCGCCPDAPLGSAPPRWPASRCARSRSQRTGSSPRTTAQPAWEAPCAPGRRFPAAPRHHLHPGIIYPEPKPTHSLQQVPTPKPMHIPFASV